MEILDERRRKLLFRATRRGFKEADLIVGGFVEHNIASFNDNDLNDLEVLLSQADNDIYDWYMRKTEVPAEQRNRITLMMLDHAVIA